MEQKQLEPSPDPSPNPVTKQDKNQVQKVITKAKSAPADNDIQIPLNLHAIGD